MFFISIITLYSQTDYHLKLGEKKIDSCEWAATGENDKYKTLAVPTKPARGVNLISRNLFWIPIGSLFDFFFAPCRQFSLSQFAIINSLTG